MFDSCTYLSRLYRFFNRKIADYLIDNDISFVMPAVKNDKVWRLANKNWNRAKYVFTYHFGKGKNKSKEFTIFTIPNPDYDRDKKTCKKNSPFYVFATNVPIKKTDYESRSNELSSHFLNRRKSIQHLSEDEIDDEEEVGREKLASCYSSRWGIETDFRVLEHDFLEKTTSNKFNVRYFYFMTGVVLRDVWVMSQHLFKDDYQHRFPKRTLTARLWAAIVERTLDKKAILHELRSLGNKIQDGMSILV